MHQHGKNVQLWKALILTYFLSVIGLVIGDNTTPGEEDYVVDEVKWGLTNGNKTDTCILLNGIFQVLIPYDTNDDTLSDVTLLTVPRSASVTGTCGTLVQNITLSWPPAKLPSETNETDDDADADEKIGIESRKWHRLTFTFVKRGEVEGDPNSTFSEPYYELDSIAGMFYAGEAEFPGFDRDQTQFTLHARNLNMLTAPVGLSYFCQSTQTIESDTKQSSLLLSLLQAEAFHSGLSDTAPDGVDFGPRSYCPKDGYRLILQVVGFVFILSLLGAVVFLVVSWLRPKRRYGYYNL